MKKANKILAKIALTIFLIFLFVTLSLLLILEPRVKINGFSELDKNRLNSINSTISILGSYNEAIIANVNANSSIVINENSLPNHVKNAFIAVEDKRFYKHNGIDWKRVLSAAYQNVKSKSFKEGASTISQQLIKNTHLTNKKTLSRKIQEMRIARALERNYSKSEILEMYLNVLYFGNNIYGIESASKTYFNKSASKISVSEAALLAGIINNPSAYNPYKNPSSAKKRRDLVLKRMFDLNFLSSDEYASAINEEIVIVDDSPKQIQFTRSTLLELQSIYNLSSEEIFDKNFIVETRFNTNLSKQINDIIEKRRVSGVITRVVVIENASGFVISDCSTYTSDLSQLRRSPGSTLKPILCYAPALEKGDVYSITPILDEKTDFNGWSPSNYNDKYLGWTSVEESIIHSQNVTAVKLLQQVGVNNAIKTAKRVGLPLSSNDASLALALGCTSNGLTLPEITSAYTAFANYGNYMPPKYISKIVDKSGKVLFCAKNNSTKVFDDDTAYIVTNTLNKCSKVGTAKKISKYGVNCATKTGTVGSADGNTDAYCITYTPNYTVGVWMGKLNGLMDNKVSGGTIPTEIAGEILAFLNDNEKFVIPNSVVELFVDERALKERHEVLLASDKVDLLHKKRALFSKKHAPKKYSTQNSFMDDKSILDDFDNFKIVYGFSD